MHDSLRMGHRGRCGRSWFVLIVQKKTWAEFWSSTPDQSYLVPRNTVYDRNDRIPLVLTKWQFIACRNSVFHLTWPHKVLFRGRQFHQIWSSLLPRFYLVTNAKSLNGIFKRVKGLASSATKASYDWGFGIAGRTAGQHRLWIGTMHFAVAKKTKGVRLYAEHVWK